jgi:hypothetical protein
MHKVFLYGKHKMAKKFKYFFNEVDKPPITTKHWQSTQFTENPKPKVQHK